MIHRVHRIMAGVFYIHKIDHRNGSSNKSQWIVSEPDERNCFRKGYTSWRCGDHICWGLHFNNNQVTYLGVTKSSRSEQRSLFVAKFIDSNQNSRWHGYPADHVLNWQDIPPENILALWLQANHLRPAIIRKLSKGQKCKL